MWYIFKDQNCIASCDFEPNHEDLAERDEIAIESDEMFDITKIILQDGQIQTKEQPVPTLDQIKDIKWAEIKSIRDRLEREPLPYLNKLFDFDEISSERLNWAVEAATTAKILGQDFEVTWTCYDNTTIVLNADDILGLPLAIAQRNDQLHQTARGLREQIYSATTVEEVKAIKWPE